VVLAAVSGADASTGAGGLEVGVLGVGVLGAGVLAPGCFEAGALAVGRFDAGALSFGDPVACGSDEAPVAAALVDAAAAEVGPEVGLVEVGPGRGVRDGAGDRSPPRLTALDGSCAIPDGVAEDGAASWVVSEPAALGAAWSRWTATPTPVSVAVTASAAAASTRRRAGPGSGSRARKRCGARWRMGGPRRRQQVTPPDAAPRGDARP
jgi:hypothetical protein